MPGEAGPEAFAPVMASQAHSAQDSEPVWQVQIRQAVLEQIVAHASVEVPNECCGLLIGTPDRVERAFGARNLRASPSRYQIDPVDHFAAIKEARAIGLTVVGAYHSHPSSPPVPSDTDAEEATYPEYLYLIVSPGGDQGVRGETRGYRLVEGRLRPVALAAIP